MILLPCPFCGGTDLQTIGHTSCYEQTPIFAVNCEECGAEGPLHREWDKAESHWNTRQALPVVPPAGQKAESATDFPPISPQTGQD
jgi:Lar family restriction alleviation protein